MIKPCIICGKEFKMYQKRGYTYIGKCCSRKCFFLSRVKRIQGKCAYCDKDLSLTPYQVRQKTNGIFCCNRKCRELHKKLHPELYAVRKTLGEVSVPEIIRAYEKDLLKIIEVAKKFGISVGLVMKVLALGGIKTRASHDYTLRPKSFSAIARRLLKERGSSCQKCGWNKAPCDVHHTLPKAKGGTDDKENLIILCPNCHRLMHRNKLMI